MSGMWTGRHGSLVEDFLRKTNFQSELRFFGKETFGGWVWAGDLMSPTFHIMGVNESCYIYVCGGVLHCYALWSSCKRWAVFWFQEPGLLDEEAAAFDSAWTWCSSVFGNLSQVGPVCIPQTVDSGTLQCKPYVGISKLLCGWVSVPEWTDKTDSSHTYFWNASNKCVCNDIKKKCKNRKLHFTPGQVGDHSL